MSALRHSPRRMCLCKYSSLARCIFLLLLCLSIRSTLVTAHRCGFDELEAATVGTRVSGISRVVKPTLTGRLIDTPYQLAAASTTWQPIRIRVFTQDLDNSSTYCTRVAQLRPTFRGGTAQCTSEDVLTDAKKAVLTEMLIPSAIKMHEERLNVQPVDGNIVVGSNIAGDSICGQFAIPEEHKTTGVSDADFVLYMSAGLTTGNTIAWATTCQFFDDSGRPSVGVSTVSPKYISADPQTVRVITHELLHALGFNINTFRTLNMYATASVRGKNNAPVLNSLNVLAKTQAQYGCATQEFMELEDEGGDGTAYSHWKRRSAKDELMAGISGAGFYTALTIAAMEDMKFYQGNYANAEPMSYGQNVGCALTTSKCVSGGQSQFSSMFCADDSSDLHCTSDHRAMGRCYVTHYSTALGSSFQYFSDPNEGGNDALMDYCPYVQEYSNSNCLQNTGLLIGGVYGVSSRCLTVADGVKVGKKTNSQFGVCVDVSCGDTTYDVKVYGASGYTTCPPGKSLTLSSLSSKFSAGTLVCPAYDAVCGMEINVTLYKEYRDILGDSATHVKTPFAVAVLAVAVQLWIVL